MDTDDIVWVVEQGNYSERYVVGVFTSLEKVLEHFGKYGTWKQLPDDTKWAAPGTWSNNNESVAYNDELDATPLRLNSLTDEAGHRRLFTDDLTNASD